MRKIFTIAILAFSINSFAQIPTNGQIGWYPFNGNAIDESVNSNDGTVTGATLTIDRFGNTNSAYSFNGISNKISIPNVAVQGSSDRTISCWIKTTSNGPVSMIISTGSSSYDNGGTYNLRLDNFNQFIGFMGGNFTSSNYDYLPTGTTVLNNGNWHCIIATYTSGTLTLYVDGIVEHTANLNLNTVGQSNFIGVSQYPSPSEDWFNGEIDDVGFWDRVLTPSEINQVFNNGLCYQTITVTDTLIINTNITGFNPVTYQNTIKVWPNPTNDHITIDNGNIANLTGYQIKITNSLSQQVFQSAITQQQFYVDLTTWTGNGIYFVHIIDGQGNTIDIKKIVLQ